MFLDEEQIFDWCMSLTKCRLCTKDTPRFSGGHEYDQNIDYTMNKYSFTFYLNCTQWKNLFLKDCILSQPECIFENCSG